MFNLYERGIITYLYNPFDNDNYTKHFEGFNLRETYSSN